MPLNQTNTGKSPMPHHLRSSPGKFGLNPEMLAFSLLDPHPRMNLTLTRREAQDIAAYISTLAK